MKAKWRSFSLTRGITFSDAMSSYEWDSKNKSFLLHHEHIPFAIPFQRSPFLAFKPWREEIRVPASHCFAQRKLPKGADHSPIHRPEECASESMHSLVHTYMMHGEWGRGLAEQSNTSFPSMCRAVHLRLLLQTLKQCHLRYTCATCMSPRFITVHMKIQSYQSLALGKTQGAELCAYALWGGKKTTTLQLFFLSFFFFGRIIPVFSFSKNKIAAKWLNPTFPLLLSIYFRNFFISVQTLMYKS